MAYIKLKKLTAKGKDKNDSIIEFGDKLTIISGPSDSGKSCVFKCINYVLGASNKDENLPFDANEGFNEIELELETNLGSLTLNRKQKDAFISVKSNIQGITSDNYYLKAGKDKKTLNSVFLKLINEKEGLKLPRNSKGEEGAFTWRTLTQSFLIDEGRADTTDSILLIKQGQPLYLASLIHQLTGDSLSQYSKTKKQEIELRKNQKNTLIEFIKKQREKLTSKKKELEDKISKIKTEKTFDEEINSLNEKIDNLTAEIDEENKTYQQYAKEIIEIKERLNKNNLIINKYDALKTQYETDISRLSFIVENEELIKNKQQKTKCPFCESEITPHDHSSYIEASRAELSKTMKKFNELEETWADIKDKIDDDNEMLNHLIEESKNCTNKINKELIPEKKKILDVINQYKEYLQIEGSLSFMDENDKDLLTNQTEIEKEEIPVFKPFNAKTLFYSMVESEIPLNAKEILEKVNYPQVTSVKLEKKSLDLTINEKLKTNRGKGYKAFYNSTLLLAFRKLLNAKENTYHLFVFDSPLKNLYLSEGDISDHNIRKGFIKYLYESTESDQVVIIDNFENDGLNELEKKEGIQVYEFSGDVGDKRYGFLDGIVKK